MKIVLQNSSLLFKSKSLLSGDITLVKQCQLNNHQILITTGIVSNNSDDVNLIFAYSLVGLPIGTKITIGTGKVSKLDLYNASQRSNLKRYVISNIKHQVAGSGISKIVTTDSNTYTKDSNNEVIFSPIVVTKSSLDEKMLFVCDVAEPVVTIEVSDVVNSGTLEIQGTTYADNKQFSDTSGNTKDKSYSRIYKYPVVNNSYYLIYTKFTNNDDSSVDNTLVAFTNEEGTITSTIVCPNGTFGGNPFAVFAPSGAKFMLVQGANNQANYLDGREISTAVYEMEVVTE